MEEEEERPVVKYTSDLSKASYMVTANGESIKIEDQHLLTNTDDTRVEIWMDHGKMRARAIPTSIWDTPRTKENSDTEESEEEKGDEDDVEPEEQPDPDPTHYLEEITLDMSKMVVKDGPDPYADGFAEPIDIKVEGIPHSELPAEKRIHLFGGLSYSKEECTPEAVRQRGPPKEIVDIFNLLQEKILAKITKEPETKPE